MIGWSARPTMAEVRREASAVLDDALRHGLGFAFDENGRLTVLAPVESLAPTAEEYRLCVLSPRIDTPIMRTAFEKEVGARLRDKGRVMLWGAQCLDADGNPLMPPVEHMEAAWMNHSIEREAAE